MCRASTSCRWVRHPLWAGGCGGPCGQVDAAPADLALGRRRSWWSRCPRKSKPTWPRPRRRRSRRHWRQWAAPWSWSRLPEDCGWVPTTRGRPGRPAQQPGSADRHLGAEGRTHLPLPSSRALDQAWTYRGSRGQRCLWAPGRLWAPGLTMDRPWVYRAPPGGR